MSREKNLQDKCIAYLKKNNIYYLNLYGDGFSGKGKPDIVACINGKFVAFELKVKSNNMQDAQKIHKLRIERSNGLHFVPYTLEEFITIVQKLNNEK